MSNLSDAFPGCHFFPYFIQSNSNISVLNLYRWKYQSLLSFPLEKALVYSQVQSWKTGWVGGAGACGVPNQNANTSCLDVAGRPPGLCFLGLACFLQSCWCSLSGGLCVSAATSGNSTWKMLSKLPSSWGRNGTPEGTSRKCQQMPLGTSVLQAWDRRWER